MAGIPVAMTWRAEAIYRGWQEEMAQATGIPQSSQATPWGVYSRLPLHEWKTTDLGLDALGFG